MISHLRSILKIKSSQEDSIPAMFGILSCLKGITGVPELLDHMVTEYISIIEEKRGLFEFKYYLKCRVEHILVVKETRWWIFKDGAVHETHPLDPLAYPASDKDSALDEYLHGKA